MSTASHLSEGFTELSRKTPTPLTITLWTLIILGLAAVQFPGILFYHDVAEPEIFGMPFIYGFNVLVWGFLCVVLLIAYRARWADLDRTRSTMPSKTSLTTGRTQHEHG